jgi:hypothetical protein
MSKRARWFLPLCMAVLIAPGRYIGASDLDETGYKHIRPVTAENFKERTE